MLQCDQKLPSLFNAAKPSSTAALGLFLEELLHHLRVSMGRVHMQSGLAAIPSGLSSNHFSPTVVEPESQGHEALIFSPNDVTCPPEPGFLR